MAGNKLQRNAQGQRIKKDGTLAKPSGRKPDPNKVVSPGHGKGRNGLRPHVWLIGPDHEKHKLYLPWLRAKAQANFRGEDWDLTFEQFFKIWDGSWEKRGRKNDSLCMTRIDMEGAWTKKNVHLVTRYEHLLALAAQRKAKGINYNKRGPDKQKRKPRGY